MSRKAVPGALIHCEYCGEDYSATYKRCPFCGEKPSPDTAPIPPLRRDDLDDDFVFEGQDLFDAPEENEEPESRSSRSRGGRRLGQEDGETATPINWPRLITFICSLVMIAAALIIVFAYLYPKIHAPGTNPPVADNPPDASETVPASTPPTQPIEIEPSDEPTAPPETTDEPTADVTGKITGISTALRVRSAPNAESEKVGSLKNGTAISVVSDAGNGWYQISFTEGGKTVTGFVMSKYVKVDAGSVPTAPPAASDQPLSGGLKTGPAKIANAASGLRVRSGPGTTYDKVGSLKNGDDITVVADADGDWYQISYSGSGGTTVNGYIKGEYISQN